MEKTITVDHVRLAADLAEKALRKYWYDRSLENDSMSVLDNMGNSSYTEFTQELFDAYYYDFYTFLKKYK